MISHWIIQNSGLRAFGQDETDIMDALKKAKIPFYGIGVIPFTNEITIPDDLPMEPGFIHCSTKLLKILSSDVPSTEMFPNLVHTVASLYKEALQKSIFYVPQYFDQRHYKYILGTELLNHDARIMKISNIMHEELMTDWFIKPSSDLKLFKGGVFEAGMSLYQQVCSSGMVDSSFLDAKDDLVVVGKVKPISKEWRLIVVDNEVVTGSQYMLDGLIKYDSDVPQAVYDYASYITKMYNPGRMYVMDIAESWNIFKVIEYNCINASGLYHSDIKKFAERISIC